MKEIEIERRSAWSVASKTPRNLKVQKTISKITKPEVFPIGSVLMRENNYVFNQFEHLLKNI